MLVSESAAPAWSALVAEWALVSAAQAALVVQLVFALDVAWAQALAEEAERFELVLAQQSVSE